MGEAGAAVGRRVGTKLVLVRVGVGVLVDFEIVVGDSKNVGVAVGVSSAVSEMEPLPHPLKFSVRTRSKTKPMGFVFFIIPLSLIELISGTAPTLHSSIENRPRQSSYAVRRELGGPK